MGGEQIRPVHNSKPALMQVIIGAVFDVLDFGALATALRIGRFGFVLLNRRACRLFSYLLRSANSRSVATGGMAMLSMIVFRRLVVALMRFLYWKFTGKLESCDKVVVEVNTALQRRAIFRFWRFLYWKFTGKLEICDKVVVEVNSALQRRAIFRFWRFLYWKSTGKLESCEDSSRARESRCVNKCT